MCVLVAVVNMPRAAMFWRGGGQGVPVDKGCGVDPRHNSAQLAATNCTVHLQQTTSRWCCPTYMHRECHTDPCPSSWPPPPHPLVSVQFEYSGSSCWSASFQGNSVKGAQSGESRVKFASDGATITWSLPSIHIRGGCAWGGMDVSVQAFGLCILPVAAAFESEHMLSDCTVYWHAEAQACSGISTIYYTLSPPTAHPITTTAPRAVLRNVLCAAVLQVYCLVRAWCSTTTPSRAHILQPPSCRHTPECITILAGIGRVLERTASI
jgi:hypothetical protein